jgi:hypothetical protein
MRKTLLAALVLGAAALHGHHSIPGNYFVDQTTRLDGDVIEFAYQSPHALVKLAVRDPQTGEITNWTAEWGPPRRLDQRGITKDSIKPGDHVIIEGNPSRKSGDHQIFVRGILRSSDGWKTGREIK